MATAIGCRSNSRIRARVSMNKGDYQTTVPAAPTGRPPIGGQVERHLAAVIAVDIVGYSAMMGHDEEDTHRRVGRGFGRVFKEIEKSRGRVFTFAGDGIMAEFPSAVKALTCALRVHADIARRNAKLPEAQRIHYRIGINSGEIMIQGDRTGGTAVNIAARLEQLAEPGGICLSSVVVDQVKRIVAIDYLPMGEQRLKNIRDPVPVWRITPESCGSWSGVPKVARRLVASFVRGTADYRPSLAVLPFRTLHPDQEDAYFAEGMVDDIIRVLGGLKHMIVVSRSSTLGFSGALPDLGRIGRDLDVQYVLHGSVRRLGDQVRIAVELSEASSRQSIWADRYDGAMHDFFALQDRIALRTAGAIAPFVRERELRRATRKDASNMTAYDLMLQALDQMYAQDRDALVRAEGLLLNAIELDPTYATAYSHLGYLQLFRIGQGWSENEHQDRVRAVEFAQRAVELDHNDAQALAIVGLLRGYLLKDHEWALAILERAIAAGPSCALAWTFSSLTCGIMGDTDAALVRAQNGLRLSPVGPDAGCWHEHALSQAYYLAGRFDEAIIWGRAAASHGNQTSNLRCLTVSLVAAGKLDEAREIADRLMQVSPGFRLHSFRDYTPLKGEVRDVFVERLRLAGLPE
jgi:class 3 adenylate cyclase/TolB-like protein